MGGLVVEPLGGAATHNQGGVKRCSMKGEEPSVGKVFCDGGGREERRQQNSGVSMRGRTQLATYLVPIPVMAD